MGWFGGGKNYLNYPSETWFNKKYENKCKLSSKVIAWISLRIVTAEISYTKLTFTFELTKRAARSLTAVKKD